MRLNIRGIKAKFSSTFSGSTKDPESLPCTDVKDSWCHEEQPGDGKVASVKKMLLFPLGRARVSRKSRCQSVENMKWGFFPGEAKESSTHQKTEDEGQSN